MKRFILLNFEPFLTILTNEDLLDIFKDANTEEIIKFVYEKYRGTKFLSESTIINNIINTKRDYE